MPTTKKEKTYTYRNGQKVELYKKNDEFVVRAQPDELKSIAGVKMTEKVSPHAMRMHVATAKLEDAMTQCRTIAITHHAYYDTETEQSFDITDRIIVTFKPTPSESDLNTFMAKYALIQIAQYSDCDFLYQLTNDTGMNPVKLIVKITENEANVAFAEHDLNRKVKKYSLTLPTDVKYTSQWHLHTRNQPSLDFDPRSSARCEEAWQLLDNFGSADVVIGLSDDGCKLDHADFNSPNKFAGWGYFVGNSLIKNNDIGANPAMMYEAGATHGTSCAGVIAGEADGVLTVGAAPNCRLLPIKWESEGPSLLINDSNLMAALLFIQDKVDVFSNSWGGVPQNLYPIQFINFINQLSLTGGRRGKGIVFLWAAGNENCPIAHTGTDDVPYSDGWRRVGGARQWVGVKTSRRFINNLSNQAGVMHIAALASNAQRSHYSNYGNNIALTAPSSNVHEYRRMRIKGLGIVTTDGESPFFTEGFGGTSSATPLVAGIVGLIISANPNLTAAEVISILKQTASKDLDFTAYSRTPSAPYNFDTSWDISPVAPHNTGVFKNINSPDGTWSSWFGFGKVDAFAAVTKALGQTATSPVVVKIKSALINPAGVDAGNETITLINKGTQTVVLDGWIVRNQNNKKQALSGSINSNQTLTIRLDNAKIQLTNSGGSIALVDASNTEVDRVNYNGTSVLSGVENVF
jgi:subtilisin family serine protease